MKNLSTYELNKHLMMAAIGNCGIIYYADSWKRTDCGKLEVYVGDGKYVIVLLNRNPIKEVTRLHRNHPEIQLTVVRYLQSEGFIGKRYIYVGVQTIDASLKEYIERNQNKE